MASAGAPSSRPRQSNTRKRSSERVLRQPRQTMTAATAAGGITSQKVQRQPSVSVQNAASGMPRLGAKVAVRA